MYIYICLSIIGEGGIISLLLTKEHYRERNPYRNAKKRAFAHKRAPNQGSSCQLVTNSRPYINILSALGISLFSNPLALVLSSLPPTPTFGRNGKGKKNQRVFKNNRRKAGAWKLIRAMFQSSLSINSNGSSLISGHL